MPPSLASLFRRRTLAPIQGARVTHNPRPRENFVAHRRRLMDVDSEIEYETDATDTLGLRFHVAWYNAWKYGSSPTASDIHTS